MHEKLRLPSRRSAPYILAGLFMIVFMFGGVAAWAALAELNGAVIGEGVVTVDSHRKTVQHMHGGIVGEIAVREGDRVKAGDLLVRLDATQARADFQRIDDQLTNLQAQESRLIAERDGTERVAFPPALMERKLDTSVQTILEGQLEQFKARQEALASELDVLLSGKEIYQEAITGLNAQQRAKAREIELIQDELGGLQSLFEKGYAPRTRVLALQRESAKLEGERGEHLSEIASTREKIREIDLKVHQIKRGFHEEVVNELREVQSKIFDLRERRIQAEDVLRRIEIRAPIDGQVVGLAVHTIGGVVKAGEPLMHVVPNEDELVIDTRVRPGDIDELYSGQSAQIRFSAFNQKTTPNITGEVVTISADRIVDEATKEPYYEARVRISEEERKKLGDLELVPGMPAEVFIQTGARLAISYLAKPFMDNFNRAFRD